MQVSNWIIFGAAELMALLLLVCGFLLVHARGLKQLVGRLQDKLQSLAQDLKKTKQAYKEMEANIPEPTSYLDQIEQQLEDNREYHLTLEPDQDIALDLDPKAPQTRQIASLRHAFLITEKEASLSSEQPGTPNWTVIQSKLSSLMNFFKATSKSTPNDDEEMQQQLQDAQQRIENLEKFKTMFFELDDKWQAAQTKATNYREELENLTANQPDSAALKALLENYQSSYDEFDSALQQTNGAGGGITQVVENERKPAASDEISRLKSVAANQHQLISELQHRLEIAYSAADKDSVIEDLKIQMDQQLRYMEEADTCIKLLESELDDAHAKIDDLEAQQSAAAAEPAAIPPEFVEKLGILKEERLMMHQTIKNLQQENEQLVLQMQATLSDPNASGGNEELLQEFKQLQMQYTELESKYLELRMKA
tara:strand:+ start:1289 stop:2563 length:1275 start_codon:yes stop_codon:yes gene_type:complete